MNHPPPVTVEALIVSYETRDLLRQTITTLLTHTPPSGVVELSVAVLDNASRDGSAQMVAQEFPQVRLVRSETNLGFAVANNRLSQTSEAMYVLLLNSDVVFVEDVVTPLLAALSADPQAVVAGPRLTFRDGRPQYSSQQFPTLRFELARVLHGTKVGTAVRSVFDTGQVIAASREHALLDAREPRRTSFLWATCWLISREEILRHGLFDEGYATYDEDLDFCRRLQRRHRSALFVPAVHLIHVGGSSSTTTAKETMMQRGRRRYYSEHHGRLSALLFRFGVLPLAALKRVRAALARVTPAA